MCLLQTIKHQIMLWWSCRYPPYGVSAPVSTVSTVCPHCLHWSGCLHSALLIRIMTASVSPAPHLAARATCHHDECLEPPAPV